MSSSDNANKAAQEQHAFLGIKEEKANYQRTTHPDAQWFGSGGNYLTNAAPRADGTMPDAFYERMSELAALGGFSKLDKEWRSQ